MCRPRRPGSASAPSISNIERGANGPTVANLARIIRIYGYDLALVPREDA